VSPKSKGWNEPEDARTTELTSMADVLRGLLAQRPFARGVAVGKLARTWVEVVGDRLAAETAPSRLESGTLVVEATSGPWGTQAKFLAEQIRMRANEALGTDDVRRVHVVVAPVERNRPKPL
jgi:predicted nucleic acid-binding Zn ribbon protein